MQCSANIAIASYLCNDQRTELCVIPIDIVGVIDGTFTISMSFRVSILKYICTYSNMLASQGGSKLGRRRAF